MVLSFKKYNFTFYKHLNVKNKIFIQKMYWNDLQKQRGLKITPRSGTKVVAQPHKLNRLGPF